MNVQDCIDQQSRDLENPYIHLADAGSFLLLGAQQSTSAWDGVYFFHADSVTAHKVLHDIRSDHEPTELRVGRTQTQRISPQLTETFCMNADEFRYKAIGEATLTMQLDIRWGNDYATQGRFHTVENLGNNLYKLIGADATYYLQSSQALDVVDDWVAIHTSYDARRGGSDTWWVHQRLQLPLSGEAEIVLAREPRDLGFEDEKISDTDPVRDRLTHALNTLVVNTSFGPGILAGYPWFTQVWTRDEAISLGALIAAGEVDVVRDILIRQLKRIDDHGRISNRVPDAELGSADGIGWVCARLHDLLLAHPDALSPEQLRTCYNHVCIALDRLMEFHSVDGLIYNSPKETWMDTEGSTDDVRDGACIEIQALTLRSLRCAADLAEILGENSQWWKDKEEVLRNRVRSVFVQGDRMYDRQGDPTQRPNLFVAAYVYEDLCSREEWRCIFLTALEALWLDWGALSTIDTSHHLFRESHSGMHDDSYHRGDTWYWVNALAARMLMSYPECHEYAHQLVTTAIEDLRWLGAVGYPSEISGASHQEPFGCWSQAWSAAMLLEALLLVPVVEEH